MLVTERQTSQAHIDAEAAEWLARRRLEGLSQADERAFAAWRRADPRHHAAFERMDRALADVAALKGLAALEPLDAPAPRLGRWAMAGAGLAAAAAIAAAVVLAPGRPDLTQSTAVAEVRTLTLADGSRVTLGAASRIAVDFAQDARRVRLQSGEAFFEVAHDPARPFFVDTGGAVVRVIGTKFDVKRAGGRVEVSVLEGVVQVREAGLLPGAKDVRLLKAGQSVAAARAPLPLLAAPVGEVRAATTQPGAWRQGQLTYDDVRLSELVADLNRYYPPGVKLASRGLGDIRLAASFKAGEIDEFLRDLPDAAHLAVSRDADGTVTISEPPDA